MKCIPTDEGWDVLLRAKGTESIQKVVEHNLDHPPGGLRLHGWVAQRRAAHGKGRRFDLALRFYRTQSTVPLTGGDMIELMSQDAAVAAGQGDYSASSPET